MVTDMITLKLERVFLKNLDFLIKKEERINLLKYLIISKMKLMQIELEMITKNSKKLEDFEILLLKISNLSHKITLLEHNLNEKDFKKIRISSFSPLPDLPPHDGRLSGNN